MQFMQLPGYHVKELIHEGARSVLCRYIRDTDGGTVIAKTPRRLAPTSRDLARLRYEYELLREIDLPFVPHTFGLSYHDGCAALLLTDIEGQPLSRMLQAGPLELDRALGIAASVTRTLDALHQQRFLHKDINPDNLLLTSRGETYLIDFGIAARLPFETQTALHPDALEGTLAYIAPEQTGRMNCVIDHRADLYSLGATLYEMLAGQPPFSTTDPLELVYSHIAKMPPPLQKQGVPDVVAAIVTKLMAKAPEERYQTARGLSADLDECLQQWTAHGHIETFPLGQKDLSGELRVPRKLFGRTVELDALFASFQRARCGSVELLLVTGAAGIGKSALVREIYKPIAERGGHFISGKFDQLNRSVPCAPIIHAFRDMCRYVLTEPEEALLARRAKVSTALGQSGRLLTDIIPELELIVGPQPPMEALGGEEAQNRFVMVFQRFLASFCSADHPLVLFLDDLQWADPISLKLLESSLCDEGAGHLLVIGAYRDNEVDASHPLEFTRSRLEKAGIAISSIVVHPLASEHVAEICAEALRRDVADVVPMAALVREKTQGNPFFLLQLLRTLHEDKLLRFDVNTGSFLWEMERLHEVAVTSNVVEFMAGKLGRLPVDTQHTLQLAACIGHTFDLRTLSVIRERSLLDTSVELWPALVEGHLLPLDAEYRYLHAAARVSEGAEGPADFPIHYRFLHDRVQQAAHSLIDTDLQQAIHLRIGRLMLADAASHPDGEQLFEIAGHLNRAAALLDDPAEQRTLAHLNLQAGSRAKASTAYDAACTYFTAGIATLPAHGFEKDYELAYTLHLGQAECAQLSGRHDLAKELFDAVLGRAQTRGHSMEVQSFRIALLNAAAQLHAAMAAIRESIASFDIHVPTTEEGFIEAIGEGMERLAKNLGGRRPAQIIDMPSLEDPEQLALLRILMQATLTAYQLSPNQYPFFVLEQVNLSLERGLSALASFAFVAIGVVFAERFGKHLEACEFADLALAVNERFPNTQLTCRVNETCAAHILFYRKPLRILLDNLERAVKAGHAAGDLMYLSFAARTFCINRMGLGDELSALEKDVVGYVGLTRRGNDALCRAVADSTLQAVRALRRESPDLGTLNDDGFDEEEHRRSMEERGLTIALCWYFMLKLELACFAGDLEGALSISFEVERRIAALAGLHCMTDLPLFVTLVRCARYPSATAAEQASDDEVFVQDRARMVTWTESCPQNFRHKLLLMDAERARALGKSGAIRLYLQAIEAARENKFVHHEALACERLGQLYLAEGDMHAAQFHLSHARDAYARWGARAKVTALSERFPQLFEVEAPASTPQRRSTITWSLHTATIDATALLRAAQAIASEIVMPKVLDQLMRTVVQSVGAQRCVLVLRSGARLLVEATITADPDVVQIGTSLPLEDCPDVPHGAVNYVLRTSEPLVLADVTSDPRFASDVALESRRTRSLLCVPLLLSNRLLGILCLEHAAANFFSDRRVALLQLLAAQAAISIENATVLASVEREVALRTADLFQANERLAIELLERTRAEEEQARLQVQFHAVQEARIAEMATPFIPITDHIMVMPLIGTMDGRRAEQVLEVALAGAQQHRTRTVIFDLTGITNADTHVANTLVNTARALRLLGAETVLCGLRGDLARTFVALGDVLGALSTHATLKSAITHASRRHDERGGDTAGTSRAVETRRVERSNDSPPMNDVIRTSNRHP